ncbi:retron St85 family RNA-directed DNA polymerase [Microbulbifer sp. CnH-101-E]|uniref:retron St85 family RNA-directed DNA polymerase n=1 Tax=unclassified Microbulbifer TaxID=2619833 RepID=UPI004039B4D9
MNLLKLLANELFMSEQQLNRIFIRAPHSYKKYTIPKRSGGERLIAQPARETKLIQQWLIENKFSRFPVHDSATAYKKGSKIKSNALAHVKNTYLMKFDFQNFFTSIKEKDLKQYLSASFLWNEFGEEDIDRIARVSCINYKHLDEKCLSIGAPSSPLLSNAILYPLDEEIKKWCLANDIVYTRYADDLTFSTNERGMSSIVESSLRDSVRKFSLVNLRFNNQKTISLSKKSQRRVTGIVLSNNGELSLGRARKREIRALVHRWTLGHLDREDVGRLQGLLGFAKDIESDFIDRLSEKYGEECIKNIFKYRKPRL